MKTISYAFLACIFMACNGTTDKQFEEVSVEASDTLVVPTTEYNYLQCPKAWSLEEALAAPDSFCSIALLGDRKKYTTFPNELATMPYLRKVDVHGNQIKEIPAFLSAITELDMSSNQLKAFPKGLSNLSNLIVLDLSYNQISTIDPAVYSLKNLERLRLFDNHITELPKELFNLTKLRELAITDNPLTQIPSEISRLTNLEVLDFSSMDVNDSTFSSSMKNLKRLKTVRIGAIYVNSYSGDGNKLTFIPDWIFSLDSLETLSLDYGNISVVSEKIGELQRLKSLNLEGNQLSELPETIKNLTQLEVLFLGGNYFSEEEENKIRFWFNDNVEIYFEAQNVGD